MCKGRILAIGREREDRVVCGFGCAGLIGSCGGGGWPAVNRLLPAVSALYQSFQGAIRWVSSADETAGFGHGRWFFAMLEGAIRLRFGACL